MMRAPGVAPGNLSPGSGAWSDIYAEGELFPEQDFDPEGLHDPELVRVVTACRRCKGKRFNLVTPFAGKAFCFRDYMRGIRRLPLEHAHAVWYDNSNDAKFRTKLLKTLQANFDSYVLLEDRNRPQTVEMTDQYAKISYRCHRIYNELYERQICKRLPLSVNIEDDVEIPKETWGRLTGVLDNYPEVGTVVGSCASRRLLDSTATHPIAFTFTRVEEIGGNGRVAVRDRRLVESKDHGLDMIGSAHMGCWFTRTKLINEIGMNYGIDGVRAQDLCWGYQLNQAGHRFGIDWSVRTKHFYRRDGQKLYV